MASSSSFKGMAAGQGQLPIQPVDKPILCSPYFEPDLHWVYDQTTGIPTRTEGRRPASYWYKTERTGSAQQQLGFMAEEDRDDLPLVNALRADVNRWRKSGWLGASETTKTLLRHWSREDRLRRLFFCQIEAAETMIYLREMLAQDRVPRFRPQLSLQDHRALMQGVQVYAQRIVGLLMAAIRPDEERGEPPLLPRLNRYRAIGSSAAVRFKTVKPVQATHASHLNFVAADTGSWEQAAVFQLEMAAKQGTIQCYVRNDRLELTIPYEFYGQPRAYEPDFVVRLADGSHLLLEIKGAEPAEVSAKHQAALRWITAVNRWGRLGRWQFLTCHDPQRLLAALVVR